MSLIHINATIVIITAKTILICYSCNSNATHLHLKCNSFATQMQLICNSYAADMQLKCNSFATQIAPFANSSQMLQVEVAESKLMASWGESIKDWNNIENFLQNAEVEFFFKKISEVFKGFKILTFPIKMTNYHPGLVRTPHCEQFLATNLVFFVNLRLLCRGSDSKGWTTWTIWKKRWIRMDNRFSPSLELFFDVRLVDHHWHRHHPNSRHHFESRQRSVKEHQSLWSIKSRPLSISQHQHYHQSPTIVINPL